MKPPSLEILKNYAESGDYYSDCAQLALDRIADLESKLDRVRSLLDKWEPMANSPSDHEAGAAIHCIDDLREALK